MKTRIIFIAVLISIMFILPTTIRKVSAFENNSSSSFVSTSTVSTVVDEENTVEDDDFDFGEWLKDLFSPEFISNISALGLSFLALLKTIKENKILSQKYVENPEQIANKVMEVVKEKMGENFKPIEDKLDVSMKYASNLAKIVSLSQENTPQSKLAIYDLISNMNVIEEEVIEKAKQEIYNQIEQERIEKETALKELEEISKEENVQGRY